MTSPDEPGLRERKRVATRRGIQRAALRVVRDRGLEGATVDEIARVADVSPRTFFNYFPSKEDAILGDAPTLEGNPELEWFVADRGALLRGLSRVIMAGAAFLLHDVELVTERRAIGKLYPELHAKRMANVHRFELELADLARVANPDHRKHRREELLAQQRRGGIGVQYYRRPHPVWLCPRKRRQEARAAAPRVGQQDR